MAGSTLWHRVCVSKSVDPCFMDQEKLALRFAFFLSNRPFHGQAKPVAAQLCLGIFLAEKYQGHGNCLSTLSKSLTPHTQQKPPFKGTGILSPPKDGKHA